MSNPWQEFPRIKKIRSGFVRMGRGGSLSVVKPHLSEYPTKDREAGSEPNQVSVGGEVSPTAEAIIKQFQGQFDEIMKNKTPDSNWDPEESKTVRSLGNQFVKNVEIDHKDIFLDEFPKTIDRSRKVLENHPNLKVFSGGPNISLVQGNLSEVPSFIENLDVFTEKINYSKDLPSDCGELILEYSIETASAIDCEEFYSSTKKVFSADSIITRVASSVGFERTMVSLGYEVERLDPFTIQVNLDEVLPAQWDPRGVINFIVRSGSLFSSGNPSLYGSFGFILLPLVLDAIRQKDIQGLINLSLISYSLGLLESVLPLVDSGKPFGTVVQNITRGEPMFRKWVPDGIPSKSLKAILKDIFGGDPNRELLGSFVGFILAGFDPLDLEDLISYLQNGFNSLLGGRELLRIRGKVALEADPARLLRMASFPATISCQSIRTWEDLLGKTRNTSIHVAGGFGNLDVIATVVDDTGNMLARTNLSLDGPSGRVFSPERKVYGNSFYVEDIELKKQIDLARETLLNWIESLGRRGLLVNHPHKDSNFYSPIRL